jgi:hypothetical protein
MALRRHMGQPNGFRRRVGIDHLSILSSLEELSDLRRILSERWCRQ